MKTIEDMIKAGMTPEQIMQRAAQIKFNMEEKDRMAHEKAMAAARAQGLKDGREKIKAAFKEYIATLGLEMTEKESEEISHMVNASCDQIEELADMVVTLKGVSKCVSQNPSKSRVTVADGSDEQIEAFLRAIGALK